VNKKLLEMELIASTPKPEPGLVRSPTSKSSDLSSSDHIETAKSKLKEPLDLHHLYIKEMKEPKYYELSPETKKNNRVVPC